MSEADRQRVFAKMHFDVAAFFVAPSSKECKNTLRTGCSSNAQTVFFRASTPLIDYPVADVQLFSPSGVSPSCAETKVSQGALLAMSSLGFDRNTGYFWKS